ncbi:MAG: FtsX-like permease family protein [Planctomycetota bacterium]
MLLIFVFAGPAAGNEAADRFAADLRALTQTPHRLAGSPEGRGAGDYLLERLRGIGAATVLELEFPVVRHDAAAHRVEIAVDGRDVVAEALRANVIAAPVLGGTLEASSIYVGRGEPSDYGGRSPDGRVVVMDDHCGENWRRAFARGARAVVFVGSGGPAGGAAKHAPVPLNLPRYFIDRPAAEALGLLVDRDAVRLTQRGDRARDAVQAEPSVGAVGRNVVAYFPGTEASGEVAVVAAAYDSYGTVPSRSPAARRAANVAGLLRLAEHWAESSPRRGVLLVFFDARAQRHRGARYFYDALTMSPADHEGLVAQHEAERELVDRAFKELGRWSGASPGDDAMSPWVRDRLTAHADWARADLDRQRQNVRRRPASSQDAGSKRDRLRLLTDEVAGFDRVRRWLHRGATQDERPDSPDDQAALNKTLAQTQRSLRVRRAELRGAIRHDQQRAALRRAVDVAAEDHRVVFHATLDLSDGTPVWAPVAGDWTHRLYGVRGPEANADAPGFHARLLARLDELAERGPAERYANLDREALRDPVYAAALIPGRHVNGGAIAGAYGIYHFALMTVHDARPRDGHPYDTPENLDLPAFATQLDEAAALLRKAVDDPGMTQRPSFGPQIVTKRVGWDGKRPTGSVASRRVTGGLSESRPAAGATVALWPGDAGDPDVSWRALGEEAPADYSPIDLAPVDANGRFEVVGLRRDIDAQLTMLGFETGRDGGVTAITTQNALVQPIDSALRTDVVAARGFGMTWLGTRPGGTRKYQLMRASSDTAYRPNLSLVGRGGDDLFWYLADRATEARVKVFDAQGPVALGVGEEDTDAEGVELDAFGEPGAWTRQTATDLWRLNERRLSRLRARGVTAPDLEVLHAEAGRLAESPEPAALGRSVALSQRVYPRLQQTMEDLVHAIVALLLLSIPFAFALERLLVGATGVYGRIGGFTTIFLVTFGLLYVTHPGFAVSSTPVMIFLAFAITLLSVMVIWVLVRRFQVELKAMQGLAGAGGMPGTGSSGALAAAIGMGMSTMRRRPTRTTLTTVTVVMLTFTILCFASVSREVGVRAAALGPVTESMPGRAVLVREAGYGALPTGVLEVLGAPDRARGAWAESWWKTSAAGGAGDRPVTVARADDGGSVRLGAVMGLDEAALRAWPALRGVIGEAAVGQQADTAIADDAVYLPVEAAARLGLDVGDAVRVNGRAMRYAGPTDGGVLTRLRQADGESWLPVDVAAQAQRRGAGAGGASGADVVSNTIRLSANQVAVASNRAVAQLGGELRSVTYFAGPEEDTAALARGLTRVSPTPVWATGPTGSRRMTLGPVTRVSGLLPLLAPVVLGGLIIFGTLLGSISDRQREIYTFSALGLGPKHVGLLFFAEAGVYAAVGGLGGQLLAQVVALGASWMSAWGWIEPVSINFASTQALFAIGVVMATVLISAIYPAVRASRSANPGLARAWTMPGPEPAPRDNELKMIFPFTVSAYDLTGVVAFLAEHFRQHADAGLGAFAASDVGIDRDDRDRVRLSAEVALSPFDLGVTQRLTLTGVASDIAGVDEVEVHLHRRSGTKGDWVRANRVFVKRLRRQFLLWRTLPTASTERYRMQTLEALGDVIDDTTHNEAAASAEGAVATA